MRHIPFDVILILVDATKIIVILRYVVRWRNHAFLVVLYVDE